MDSLSAFAGQALTTAQTLLNVASDNSVNATTPGYHQETATVENTLSGPTVTQISRASDTLLDPSVWQALSSQGYWATQNTTGTTLSSLTSSISPNTALQQLATALTSLQANPTSSSASSSVITNANTVAQTINSGTDQIMQLINGVQSQMADAPATVNGILQQIADANHTIAQASQGSSAMATGLDQLHHALNSLAQWMPIQTLPESNGSVVVTSGSYTLVSGDHIAQDPQQTGQSASGLGLSNNQWTWDGLPFTPSAGTLAGLSQSLSSLQQMQNGWSSLAQNIANIPVSKTKTLGTWNGTQLSISATGSQISVGTLSTALTATNKAMDTANQWIDNVTTSTAQWNTLATNAASTATTLQTQRSNATAVNTTDAATNVMTAQQAYSVAADILSTAKSTIQTLINAVS